MAYSNSYSPAQIMAMQKDAVRRVNEMQRIAQEKLRQTESTIGGHPHPGNPEPQQRQEVPSPPPNNSSRPIGGHPQSSQGGGPHANTPPPAGHMNQNHAPGRTSPPPPPAEPPAREPDPIPIAEAELVTSPFQGILQRLNLDQESVLLIVMLLLLINEGADVMLIMALVYILL